MGGIAIPPRCVLELLAGRLRGQSGESRKAGRASIEGMDAMTSTEIIPLHVIRLNGASAGVLHANDDGSRITVCVFQRGHKWKDGDFVIFERRGGETTRYKIDRICTPHDPGDQHFLYCTFAPRIHPSPNTPGQATAKPLSAPVCSPRSNHQKTPE